MRRGAGALVAVLLISACGDDGATTSPTSTTSSSTSSVSVPTTSTALRPTTDAAASTSTDHADGPRTYVDERGKTVTIASTERIIPLDGDVAEIVFALGLGDRVVATDLSATYPPEADALPQIGYQRALNTEPILEFDPTILIGTDIAGPPEVIDELERVGVPVAIVPTPSDSSGPGTKIRAIAEILGVPEAGEQLAGDVEAQIAAATPDHDASPVAGLRVAMLYLRGPGTQLLFGDDTAIDWLIEATGAVNVADDLGVVETAEINAEALVEAAPDVLLVTEDGLASVGGIEGFLALPGVAGTPAAANGAVLAYDTQLMLGNGPRTGAFLTALVHDLTEVHARIQADKENP